MQSIRKKLHSRRGASMLIALLFFLLSLTVGSLILAAATSGASKTSGRYRSQQDYLAVASAARLLRDSVGSYTYTAGSDLHTWVDEETGENRAEWEAIAPYISPADAKNGDILTDGFISLSEGLSSYEKSFTVVAGEGMPAVSGTLSMEDDGSAVITLRCGSYAAQVSFTARTAEVTSYSSQRSITSWGEGSIKKEAAE